MVVLGVAAIFGLYRYVEESSSGGDVGYEVHALFEDAQGLIPKSRVVVAGIPIGRIEDIRLEGNLARVTMSIEDGVTLYRDASVTMRSVSLLGEKTLVVSPGSVTQPELESGGRLQVEASNPSPQDVLASVNEIAQSVRAVSQQLERSFGTDVAGQRMESALQNLSEALAGVNRTIQTNEAVVARTLQNIEGVTEAGGPRLVRILDNVERATRNIETILASNQDDLSRGVAEVDDTIASIHRASEQMEGVLADVRQVTGRTARGEGNLGRLTQDESLIDEVEGIAEGLNDVLGGIGRLQTIVELRSEYNFLANTFKTYFSLRLQPREDRYFLIQLIDDPRGSLDVSQTLVRRSPAPPGEPGEFQETRLVRTDALRFTIQFAKRVSFATFRFGIMENTGGLGLDLHVWNDRLEINTDIFALGDQTFPRLRVRAALELVSRFWVVAGIDDALNDSTDFFLGLQIRFNDEDLKSILPFVGGAIGGGS